MMKYMGCKRARGAVPVMVAALLCGCAGNGLDPRLAFMQPGLTTRADVMLQFGRPNMTFEQERILIFLLDPADRNKGPIVEDQTGIALDVVVEFDDAGRLVRHAAVPP